MKKLPLMKTSYLVMSAILSLWHITANSQTFEKVINSPLLEPIEAFGTAWGDYDNDGDQDLFINILSPSVNNPNGFSRLFQNNCNGEFAHITALPGGITQDTGTSRAASWIDMNNDGNLDLYISHDDGINNSLYINNGDGTFTKETQLNIVNDQAYTRDHAWVDINNDGWLDLFLGNSGSIPQNDFLYLSNQQGSFNQVTVGDIVNDNARTQGFSFGDYDNDGYLDIFISYNAINKLYHNNGDGTFTPITNTIASLPSISWSSSWIDYDNDLNLDLFIHGNFGWASRLLKNNNDGTFTALTSDPLVTTIVHNNGGQTWGDYDNDGDLDVFVSDFFKNQLYSNNGNGTFTAVTDEIVTNDSVAESFGATWSDFDKDGDLDLLVPNAFGNFPNYFYINTFQNMGNENHWINIKCTGKQSNISAIGTRIYVKATINGISKWQMREINANHSAFHGGQNPLNQHFGLGDATIIDSLKIYWPTSGITQLFTNVSPDRYIEITEDNNTINDGKECFADLPPKNPGIISGKIFKDDNDNCSFENNIDIPIVNRMVQSTPGPYFVYTEQNGDYEFRVPAGNYSISEVDMNNDIWKFQDCQTDTEYVIAIANAGFSTGNNFAKQPVVAGGSCDATVDIFSMNSIFPGPCTVAPSFINLTSPCPGSQWQYCINITNSGTNPIGPSSTLQVVLDPFMTFVSMASDPCGFGVPTITGCSPCTLTWNVPNASTINAGGCTLCFNVFVSSGSGFSTTANFNAQCGVQTDMSSDVEGHAGSCSCDPNDKLVAPNGCGPEGNIGRGEPLTYQIRFQNTGTGPAHDIILRDQLDSDLDITSLKILTSTHQITHVEIIPDNVLIISYDGIELPDSGSNQVGSNGSIVFSIMPKQNIFEGTTITNQAGIYFDFNEVVLTNTTLNTLRDNPEPIADFEAKHSCTNTSLVYDFTYTGGTDDNATFFWDFGSGASPQTSTQQNPTGILFSTTGTKQVTLTVTRFGCTATITKNMEVMSVMNGDKVTVCHNGHLIAVNQNALQVHLNHGDCIGSCSSSASKIANIQSSSSVKETIFTAFPNPFKEMTTINFSIEETNLTSLEIYNYMGKRVATLFNQQANEAQLYHIEFDTKELPSGIYFCVLNTRITQQLIKLVILK